LVAREKHRDENKQGILDKTIRIIVVIIGGFMVYLGRVVGSSSVVLLVVAGLFALTLLVSFCHLYYMFGLNTNNFE
jgi:hypothetical protein